MEQSAGKSKHHTLIMVFGVLILAEVCYLLYKSKGSTTVNNTSTTVNNTSSTGTGTTTDPVLGTPVATTPAPLLGGLTPSPKVTAPAITVSQQTPVSSVQNPSLSQMVYGSPRIL